jgi:hypothetical protein
MVAGLTLEKLLKMQTNELAGPKELLELLQAERDAFSRSVERPSEILANM